MFDIMSLSLSIRFLYPSIFATQVLSKAEAGKMTRGTGHGIERNGKYIQTICI
jgi:hypothetical protein